MEDISEDTTSSTIGGLKQKPLTVRLREAENKLYLAKMQAAEFEKGEKQSKVPWSWRKPMGQTTKKSNREKALVFYFNKKNEIEQPKFMPIYDGNMIVWNHKVYKFDPRAMWITKWNGKLTKVYCIREIDRRPIKNPDTREVLYYKVEPVSNQDLEDVVQSGNSTDSDELLIKAFLKAQTKEVKGTSISWIVWVIIGIVLIGLVWGISKMNF